MGDAPGLGSRPGVANGDPCCFAVAIQEWDFRPGSNFAVEMDKALKQCSRMIAVLSPAYLKAPFPASEWTAVFASDPEGRRTPSCRSWCRNASCKGCSARSCRSTGVAIRAARLASACSTAAASTTAASVLAEARVGSPDRTPERVDSVRKGRAGRSSLCLGCQSCLRHRPTEELCTVPLPTRST